MRDLLDYRSEFPILEHTTYLASHTLGPMPRRAPELLAEYARMWAERGIRRRGRWESPMRVGDQSGGSWGPPDRDASERRGGRGVALCKPDDPARNRVVYERGNFPSVRYLYQAQPDLEIVVCEDDEEILQRIDEQTLLVPISHVLFKESEIQDVEPTRRAHRPAPT
jgi:kynureninase